MGVFEPAFGREIYHEHVKVLAHLWEDSTPGSTITVTVAGTYYPWITGTVGEINVLTSSSNQIVLPPRVDGEYLVSFSVSYSSSSNNVTDHWHIHKNNSHIAQISSETKIQQAASIVNSSSIGILSLVNGDVIELRVTSSNAGEIVTINHASLMVMKI